MSLWIYLFASSWALAGTSQDDSLLLKITETKSPTVQIVMELSTDRTMAWLKLTPQKDKKPKKKLSLEKVRQMEAQLTEFIWDYNLKQEKVPANCSSFVEIELLTTQDKAKVCETDLKNFGRIRAYLLWLKKEAGLRT